VSNCLDGHGRIEAKGLLAEAKREYEKIAHLSVTSSFRCGEHFYLCSLTLEGDVCGKYLSI